jgi:hypothetical protein
MSSNIALETNLELDSHADTTVLGAGALIIQSYDQPVEVVGYDPQQGLQTFEMVSGILAFDHPRMGKYTTLCSTRLFTCLSLTITCFVPCSVTLMT